MDIFVNDIFDKICGKTKLNVQNLDIVNSTIASQISPLLSSSSNMVKKKYKKYKCGERSHANQK